MLARNLGFRIFASAVGDKCGDFNEGENAVWWWEKGNGGIIIYPDLHYGRDSLVGVALFLTHLAKRKQNRF